MGTSKQQMSQLKTFLKIGPLKFIKDLFFTKDPRAGQLVGIDRFGNEYYTGGIEFNRERYVRFKNKKNSYGGYDASQIPPEWHSWIHRINDTVPRSYTELKTTGIIPFFETFKENVTLNNQYRFKTKSTVPPKIESWTPQVQERQVQERQ